MIGRFAPSPNGPLHAGSLVAAMASWLDVRAHEGRWLVRIEDVDGPRTVAGAEESIVATLAAHGFRWDAPIVRQSERIGLYEKAFDALRAAGRVYPCGCTRREIGDAAATRTSGPVRYPGTCRAGLSVDRVPRAWRLRVPSSIVSFHDRAVGPVHQDVEATVGDFVVLRADGMWAYQLAVVVDDAEQRVTDVVRGMDLIDSTPRQWVLQEALGLPKPRTLHVPLVLDVDGEKLGKSRGARPLDASNPLPALVDAARHLDLEVGTVDSVDDFWRRATSAWATRWRAAA